MDKNQVVADTMVTPELYFLISKFLAAGPLQDTAKVLVRELEDKKVLPKRTDWLGVEHEQTFAELEQKYAHIEATHLLEICSRIGPILDKELSPSVPGIISLLGAGRQSLLRTKDSIYRPRSLLDYCTRIHGVSLPDSSITKPIHNFQKVLTGREYGGPVRRKLLVPTGLYGKTKLLRRTVGHLSSVYCVLFDRTGRYIITGADDLLIKIWSSLDGRLLATLRGASAEITDIAINLDNTMLAAGSLDRILRVWDMQTTSPIAVLAGHTGMITCVNFCPSPRSDLKYLVTTSTDGSIAFWQYSTPRGQKITFAPKPTQYHEKLRPGQAQMMCATFSPGGMFLAAGSADHHVRVYIMSEDGPKRILETEAYTDAVDSMQWSHRGLRFISGSKDGTAHIWTFESQQWKSVKLCMTERLPTCPEPEEGKKLKVTMVAWDCSDKYVITAANDFTIKIWFAKTAKLHHVLRGHKDELYVLESNPKDEHVLLSAGHDGQVFLWDIERGISVAHFVNNIDGQGHGGVFDAKWSPDGTMIAATDSHGHILIFGLGIGPDKYKILPTELFFHTDYRPLLRDTSHHVVDEQTQIMPHLMAPPFLVDADGNPHNAKFQRYVPGREICSTEQLVPNLSAGTNLASPEDNTQNNYSQIDRLIAALATRQGGAGPGSSVNNQVGRNHSPIGLAPDSNHPSAGNLLGNRPTSRNANDVRQRRISDASNTPRQGTTWGRPPATEQQQPLQPTQTKYIRRIYVRPMKYAQLQNLKQAVYAAGQFEMQEYKREMRRRPIMINTASTITSSQAGAGRQRNAHTNGGASTVRRRGGAGHSRGAQQQVAPVYRTRAVRDQEELNEEEPAPQDEDDEDDGSNSGDTSFSNVEENLEENSEDSDTDSSDYSDWVADTPGPNLEPPKRSKRKPLSRRRTFSDDSSDESAEQATTSAGAAAAKTTQRKKRVEIPPPSANGEIPDLFRPPEWLSEVIPRKAPYYPQMGDEIVYFRQGHHRYLEAVRTKKVYKISHSSEPWNFRTLRDHELVRIIGIKYEIRPPRLCCLKLAMIDVDGNMTGTTFKIKYHDMPDVLDFLVLRQTFDLAVQRNWSVGDRFRCMIGDGWWMGEIESRHLLSADFPDSYFMCFRVRWDNGEYEYMSPWDMEPIDEQRLPDQVGGAVSVLPEEIRATLYQPKSEEWHRGDRDGSCRRIINGLEQVMRLSIAEHFLAPVDLNIYPDYAYLIEYPIDLTTVKSRFENHFYRRITTAQFDVRYLATNAEKYNRSHTNIVKHARIITDLCLRIIREPNDIDVAAIYHQLVDVYHSSESENDNESDVVPSTSTGPSTSAAARKTLSASTRRSKRIRSDGDWRSDCRQLLDMMWLRPDSVPFREPVDTIEFPDYLEIIATPMDLRTVKEDLLGGNYDDPLDFAKDVRLIFQNSKNYNTNKRSRIYSMTLRLSALFESHIKKVVNNWKTRRRAEKNKIDSARGSSTSPSKRNTNDRGRAGPSTRKNQKATTRRLLNSSDDDDDDDDDDEVHNDRKRGVQRRNVGMGGTTSNGRNGYTRSSAAVASTSGSNRVTSSSHRHAVASEDAATTRSTRRKAASQDVDEDEDEDLHVTENTSSAASDDNTSDDATSDNASESHNDDDDDDSNNGRHRRRNRKKRSGDEDSEDSYKPVANRRKNCAKPKKSNRKNKQVRRKHRIGEDNEEDDDDDDYTATTPRKVNGVANRRVATTKPAAPQRSRGQQQQQQRRVFQSSDEETLIRARVSQGDESTQDTVVGHTPKKKGRPPKVRANTVTANGAGDPSTSAQALRRGSRRNAAENDHSYHLPMRNGRVAESDNDSHGVSARPTRSSVKRAILDWARSSDVEEQSEAESEEAEEILPTPTPTKTNGETNGPTSSRSVVTATRQLRTNRNTVVEPTDEENTDNDGGSDNEPLSASQTSHKQRTRNAQPLKTTTPHPLQIQRRQLHVVGVDSSTTLHMTRSHATSTTTTSVATSSSSNSRATAATTPMAANDHNYIGDPGPSTSSAALRNSRRVLSRHQRNADELDSLDTSLDPLENSRLLGARILENSSRLRRGTPTSTSSATAAGAIAIAATRRNREEALLSAVTVRRGRSRHSQENSQPGTYAEKDETDDDEDDDADGGSDEGTNGGSSSQSDGASDSEDNQPLTSYVPATTRQTRNHVKSSRKTNRKRRHRSGGSDDSFNDAYGRRQRHERNVQTRKNRKQRDTRNIKRPRYNEQSDEDGSQQNYVTQRKRRRHETVVSSNQQQQEHQQAPTTRTEDVQPPVDENDEGGTSATDNSADDEQLVSVSSRGRVRKITAKARGIFKE